MTEKLTPLTPHQRWALLRLATVQRLQGGGFVSVKDTGSPGAMEHLHDKGYADRRVEHGPRGGTTALYALNAAGITERQRIIDKGLSTRGR